MKAKRVIKWVIFNGVFLATLIAGTLFDVEGADNIATFFIWLTVFISPFYQNERVLDALRQKGGFAVSENVEWTFNIIIIALLVWDGRIITGAFYLLSSALTSVAYTELAKVKTEETMEGVND